MAMEWRLFASRSRATFWPQDKKEGQVRGQGYGRVEEKEGQVKEGKSMEGLRRGARGLK
jgi:hypothetical protein